MNRGRMFVESRPTPGAPNPYDFKAGCCALMGWNFTSAPLTGQTESAPSHAPCFVADWTPLGWRGRAVALKVNLIVRHRHCVPPRRLARSGLACLGPPGSREKTSTESTGWRFSTRRSLALKNQKVRQMSRRAAIREKGKTRGSLRTTGPECASYTLTSSASAVPDKREVRRPKPAKPMCPAQARPQPAAPNCSACSFRPGTDPRQTKPTARSDSTRRIH